MLPGKIFTLEHKIISLSFSVPAEATNKFINENSNDIVEEVKPAIEMVASMLLDDIANKVFKNIPVSKVFPEE